MSIAGRMGWPNNGGVRVEVYEGVTDASGLFTVIFPTPFNATPHVNPQCMPNTDPLTRVRVVSRDKNGFTVKTENNPGIVVALLSLTLLGSATAPVTGQAVSIEVVGN